MLITNRGLSLIHIFLYDALYFLSPSELVRLVCMPGLLRGLLRVLPGFCCRCATSRAEHQAGPWRAYAGAFPEGDKTGICISR